MKSKTLDVIITTLVVCGLARVAQVTINNGSDYHLAWANNDTISANESLATARIDYDLLLARERRFSRRGECAQKTESVKLGMEKVIGARSTLIQGLEDHTAIATELRDAASRSGKLGAWLKVWTLRLAIDLFWLVIVVWQFFVYGFMGDVGLLCMR